MSMPIEYTSFLIRLWREVTPPPSPSPERRGARRGVSDWRGEAEHIQTGACWTFDTLDELLDFLRKQIETPSNLLSR